MILLENNLLKAEPGYLLKFKEDIGFIDEYGNYYMPNFFEDCFPSKNIDTIEKASKLFEEIPQNEKLKYLDIYRNNLLNNKE